MPVWPWVPWTEGQGSSAVRGYDESPACILTSHPLASPRLPQETSLIPAPDEIDPGRLESNGSGQGPSPPARVPHKAT